MSRSLDTKSELSTSSVVVMPEVANSLEPPTDSPKSTTTGRSLASDDYDTLSETSFVSVGTLSDDEDAEVWADSRREVSRTHQSPATDYVLLYDDNSSDDDL
jgi:hypothetical protein